MLYSYNNCTINQDKNLACMNMDTCIGTGMGIKWQYKQFLKNYNII